MVRTLAYADVFDYPLTAAEVHRDLVGLRATTKEVVAALDEATGRGGTVVRVGGHYTLTGREGLAATRTRREAVAATMWPCARRSARVLAALPWVRMVGVTGSLAVDSVEADADIDLMVVAAQGRVWSCRAVVTAFARAASRRRPALCPNYVISGGVLSLDERSLYTAHELVQMVPLAGRETYVRLLEANPWTSEFLPNRTAGVPSDAALTTVGSAFSRITERLLRGHAGEAFERRVGRLQTSRLRRKIERGRLGAREAEFGADTFKGHFDAHGARILATWANRTARAMESG